MLQASIPDGPDKMRFWFKVLQAPIPDGPDKMCFWFKGKDFRSNILSLLRLLLMCWLLDLEAEILSDSTALDFE